VGVVGMAIQMQVNLLELLTLAVVAVVWVVAHLQT
jgi:hypothetical protein